jgi:hypothetical protein
MSKIPSDRKILQTIYDRYRDRFARFDKGSPDREAKILIPIDCGEIATRLNVDPDVVFGRLYYHLENKYGYRKPDGVQVLFFGHTNNERNCINFPLSASVLAGLQEERNKHLWAIGVALVSLVLSVAAIGVSIFAALHPR